MVEVNNLMKKLLPETQQRLGQEWLSKRYSGTGDAGRYNRYAFLGVSSAGSNNYSKSSDPNAAGSIAQWTATGAAAGGQLGGWLGAGIGAGAGALIGIGKSWSGKKESTWAPGKAGYYGQAWEAEVDKYAPNLAKDSGFMTLAQLFASPTKNQDPYAFSRYAKTRKHGWNRRRQVATREWLNPQMRPGDTVAEAIKGNGNEGFLDWKGYSGSGANRYKKYSSTVIENSLSRYLFGLAPDIWQAELKRKSTWRNPNLDLSSRSDDYQAGSGGYVPRSSAM